MKRIALLAFAVLLVGSWAVSAQGVTGQNPPTTQKTVGPNFVDANGDGICDNFQAGNGQRRMGAGRGRGGYGPGDGTGRQGMGPKNGTGFGPGAASGACDGTGPKGQGQGRGRGPRR